MSAYLGPRCLYCKNYNSKDPGTCSAFPEGIPCALLRGQVEHLAPYEGDHGILFELDPKLTPEDVSAYHWRFDPRPE